MSAIAQVEPMTTARAMRGPFDYRLPEELRGGAVEVGSMLVVPFGRREVLGVVVGLAERSEVAEEKLLAPLRALEPGSAGRPGGAGRVDRGRVLLDDRARARPRVAARRRATLERAQAPRCHPVACTSPSARAVLSHRS